MTICGCTVLRITAVRVPVEEKNPEAMRKRHSKRQAG